MDDSKTVPDWIVPGTTVWAWLPQMPSRYYVSTTRWQCQVLAVLPYRSRHKPASVILSVPTEVYMGKSFCQHYPLFDEFVDHPNDANAKALSLTLYRNGLLLERVEALTPRASESSEIAQSVVNSSAASAEQSNVDTSTIILHENNVSFDEFCTQFLEDHDRSMRPLTDNSLDAPAGTKCCQCLENIMPGLSIFICQFPFVNLSHVIHLCVSLLYHTHTKCLCCQANRG